MGATDAFDKLNPRQREAACAGTAPLLIVAGAGTGKTNTLAHRVAHLVLQGCPPERLLLLTFTRRAALEMTRRASRIVAEVKKEVRLPWSGTFHSIANRLIRKHCKRLGLTESFSVLDRGDAADLMDVVRHERGLSKAEKRFPRKDTCLAIYSHRVNTQRPLADTLALMFPWCAEWQEELTGLFRDYVERKIKNQSLDYDDLLLYWHAMMQDDALAAEIGARFDHVLVDEYQDTNVLQAEILQRLKPAGQGLTVVGDDAQAIYSFRAATVENIRGFAQHYQNQGQTTISLEENYRSTQQVLDAANALIGKSLYSKKKVGAKPRYVTVADDEGQAQYVVTRVLEARERGVLLRNQAVLFRASSHSDLLELELVRRNIPYVKYGGLKFLEAAHVKDLLAVLRWADNPKNRVAAFRALQLLPGVGPAGAARVFTAFEAAGSWQALKTGSAELDELMKFLARSRRGRARCSACASGTRRTSSAFTTRRRYGPGIWCSSSASPTVSRSPELPHGNGARSAERDRRPVGRAVPRRGLPRALHRAFRERARSGRRCTSSTSPTATSPPNSPPAAPTWWRRSAGCCMWR